MLYTISATIFYINLLIMPIPKLYYGLLQHAYQRRRSEFPEVPASDEYCPPSQHPLWEYRENNFMDVNVA